MLSLVKPCGLIFSPLKVLAACVSSYVLVDLQYSMAAWVTPAAKQQEDWSGKVSLTAFVTALVRLVLEPLAATKTWRASWQALPINAWISERFFQGNGKTRATRAKILWEKATSNKLNLPESKPWGHNCCRHILPFIISNSLFLCD